jgi:Family of unknown function (DUF5715)
MRALPLIALFATPLVTAAAQLRGSMTSMERQHRVAIRNDLSFLGTANEVHQFARKDLIVPVHSSRILMLKGVSYAYARPQVKMFLEQLGARYYAFAHEPIVVTSLIRPLTQQPENASPLSVHPAGMAVDLRIPDTQQNRQWLERELLSLERRSVLDVTLEFHPAHYHVAVFPTDYARYALSVAAPAPRRASTLASRAQARTTPARTIARATPVHAPRARVTRRVVTPPRVRATPVKHTAPAARSGSRRPSHSARKATTGSSRAARAAG